MTKADLIACIAGPTGQSKKAVARTLNLAFSIIANQVKRGGRVWWPGFGAWSLRTRKARRVRNPTTNEFMQLPESKTIGFRPAKSVRGRARA